LQVPHNVILTGSLTVDSSTASFGPITPSTGPGTVNLTFNLGGTNSLTFNGDAGGDTATRLGNLIVNGGASLTINPGFTVYVMAANLSSGQINLGDTLNVLNGVTITGAQSVTGDILGSSIQISAGSANVNAVGGQSISVTAPSIAGSFEAPTVALTGQTVTGDIDTQSLTVTNADTFTVTGTINGQSGPAAAAQIVFIGGSAGTSGTFNGINVSTGLTPGSSGGTGSGGGGGTGTGSGTGAGTGAGTGTSAGTGTTSGGTGTSTGSGTGPTGGTGTGTGGATGAGTAGGGNTGTGSGTATGAGSGIAAAGSGSAPESGAFDAQIDANHQIVAPIATALADPGAPLGVGAGTAPAAGGGDVESDEDQSKKAETVTPPPIDSVYDYANKFLDGTLKRP
jgi:hypothetical protein